MSEVSSVGSTDNGWKVGQQDSQLEIENQWEQSLNQPNVEGATEQVGLPEDVKKVVGDMIGNMAIEAIKMHNPAKKISMDGEDE